VAQELQFSYQPNKDCYFLIRNRVGLILKQEEGIYTFVSYVTANYSEYPIDATEQGTASGFYTAEFPNTVIAGVYSVVAKLQLGGNPAETDPTVATGDVQWNGSAVMPLSDVATSGQLSRYLPLQLARGVAVPNFHFYLVSQADHVTPFTSGVCSGQIARDGGSFVALQSGAFTEVGLGFYRVQALTSGDLLCNTASLLFNATGVSGGPGADPRPFTLVLQRTSGQQVA
jgi:hypothetical protein